MGESDAAVHACERGWQESKFSIIRFVGCVLRTTFASRERSVVKSRKVRVRTETISGSDTALRSLRK